MKIPLDTNNVIAQNNNKTSKRSDFFIVQDVEDEWVNLSERASVIKNAGIEILEINAKHLKKLQEVLTLHGNNFDLIGLYTGEGTADVIMLAYILAEKE